MDDRTLTHRPLPGGPDRVPRRDGDARRAPPRRGRLGRRRGAHHHLRRAGRSPRPARARRLRPRRGRPRARRRRDQRGDGHVAARTTSASTSSTASASRSRLGLLERRSTARIFQDKDVKEIVAEVLQDLGVDDEQQSWRLTATYPKREYCVQYSESALAFVSRLLRGGGHLLLLRQGDAGELIVFDDDSTPAEPIDGDPEVPYRHGAGLDAGRRRGRRHHPAPPDAPRARSPCATTTSRSRSST